MMKLKIYPRRLKKARDLWWKKDPQSLLQTSELEPETQSDILVKLLARAIPEFVAPRAGGKWYCSGFRVRGVSLPSSSPSGWILVFNPSEAPWTRRGLIKVNHA